MECAIFLIKLDTHTNNIIINYECKIKIHKKPINRKRCSKLSLSYCIIVYYKCISPDLNAIQNSTKIMPLKNNSKTETSE